MPLSLNGRSNDRMGCIGAFHARFLRSICGSLLLVLPCLLWGQGDQASDAGEDGDSEPMLLALTEEERAALDRQRRRIDEQKNHNRQLERLYRQSDDVTKSVLGVRLAENWTATMQASLQFGREVLAYQQQNYEVPRYTEQVVAELKQHPSLAAKAEKTIESRLLLPHPEDGLADQAAASNRLFALLQIRDELNHLLFDSLELSKAFGIDVAEIETEFGNDLEHRAANTSVLLSMAMDEVRGKKEALSMIPGDPDLTARLALSEKHVSSLANVLGSTVSMLDRLGRDIANYREQIIGATGEISTDIFDPAVLFGLLRGWGSKLLGVVVKDGPNILLKLFIFVGIIFIFRRLSRLVRNLVERGLNRSNLRLSQLLRHMIMSWCGNIVMIIGVLIGLSQVGIALGPLLAGLGVAGFVIGFALQDTLSNFASGLMILSYRPFDVGDVVEAGGVFGTVRHMSLVTTTIMTFDNQTNVVPNNKIWGDVIKNVTSQTTRRIDFVFGIGYDDDIVIAERVLSEIVDAEERILDNPAPIVRLHELADSSVNFVVRPWVKTADYWSVYWDITRAVKLRFDEEKISIPYPQRDVHIDLMPLPGQAPQAKGSATG